MKRWWLSNGIASSRCAPVVAADLAREGQQRAFHRVALDRPGAIRLPKLRIVAQRRRQGEPAQIPRRADRALGYVAVASDDETSIGRFGGHHDHLVSGQRPGLVGADYGYRSDRLDGGQAADDGVAPRHGLYAESQRDRHHRRQTLRDCSNGHSDTRHKEVAEGHVANKIPVCQQQSRAEQDQERQPARKVIHLRKQGCCQLLHPCQKAADTADLCSGAGRHHQSARGTLRHQRARPQHRAAVAERDIHSDRIDALFHGDGFPGQDRLLRRKTPRLQQPQIGGHLVARLQQHDVPGDEFRAVHRYPQAVAQNVGPGREHLPDRGHRRFGLAFLEEADRRIGQHDRQDHPGVHPVLQRPGDHRRADEDVDQHVVELSREAQQRTARLHLGQPIGPVGRQSARSFVRGQSGSRCIQRGKAFIGWSRMGVGQAHVIAPYSRRR